ncbi:hypothetical protein [Chryseobacterium sp. CT-SW4]|uniref:hypothetical protein n=1 Tax=Chryseobacterium sp. SW-1 TaxID=3157343 RepID=UPI003B024C0A
MKDFDIEKLERKNIYQVPDHLFDKVQERVFAEVKTSKKAPVFKLNWAFAAAASLALIFGATFVFDSDNDMVNNPQKTIVDRTLDSNKYASEGEAQMGESQRAYETLKTDLTSLEKDNQTIEGQGNKSAVYSQSKKENKTVKKSSNVRMVSGSAESQMNEFLDTFSTSEISELASNSAQDVYLDLYN